MLGRSVSYIESSVNIPIIPYSTGLPARWHINLPFLSLYHRSNFIHDSELIKKYL